MPCLLPLVDTARKYTSSESQAIYDPETGFEPNCRKARHRLDYDDTSLELPFIRS